MVAPHLLEDRERFFLKALGNCSPSSAVISSSRGSMPSGSQSATPREAVDAISGAVLECLSPQPRDQIGKVPEIPE